jgi:hypothetical protein
MAFGDHLAQPARLDLQVGGDFVQRAVVFGHIPTL